MSSGNSSTLTAALPPPPPAPSTKSDGKLGHIQHQYRVFLRALAILFTLLFGSGFLLYRYPSHPYLGWLPMLGIAGISYLSYFPRQQLRLVSYLRLCSLLLTVSVYQTLIVVALFSLVHLIIPPLSIPWRFALLIPYVFALIVFGRISPGITKHDPRRFFVHILYDPPALALCYLYSQVFHSPLNRLFTPITPQLLLGSLPWPGDVKALNAAGVTGVVNMCREWSGPLEQYTEYGIEQCYCPTIDMTAPTIQDITKAVAFITSHLNPTTPNPDRPPRVLIHCKCGMSRSASILLCYMASTKQWTPMEALRLIKKTRPEVSTDLFDYPSVQQFMASLPHVDDAKLEKDKEKEKAKEEEQGQQRVITDTIKQRLVP